MWLWLTAVGMGVRILAALRDLDPPAGGAEMSLATLLKGVIRDGPYIENAPDYTPMEEDESENEEIYKLIEHNVEKDNKGVTTKVTL